EDLHTVHLSRLLPVLLLLPLSAWAQSADFDALTSKSEPLGGLGPFLERYVGRCEDPETQKTCEANAATFRRQANGKRYAMLVDDVRSLLQAEAYDPDSGDLTLQLTPIFGAYGYALTTGRPKRLNAQGLPTMRLVKLEGRTTQGFDQRRFERMFRNGEVQLELIFTPEQVWTLPQRGGKPVQGVEVKALGVRVTHVRSGEAMVAWVRR